MGHTPGPWSVLPAAPLLIFGECHLTEQVWGDDRVCFVESQNVGRDVAKVNAKLMAASPELLEAAKAIVAFHHAVFVTGRPLTVDRKPIDHTLLNEAAKLAERAIRKVEG